MSNNIESTGSAAKPPEVLVVSCINCESPVVSSAGKCVTCGTPVTGKEFPYIARQAARPDIKGLFKWWGIWSLGVWALAGFSFGAISSSIFTAVCIVYLFRILRAYYR
jgi:hypothetical protein